MATNVRNSIRAATASARTSEAPSGATSDLSSHVRSVVNRKKQQAGGRKRTLAKQSA